MKATRLIALLLSLMLIVAMFAGCQNDTAKTDDSSSSASTSDTKKEETKKEETKKEETKKEEEKKEEEAPSDPLAEGSFEGYPMASAAGKTMSLWHGTGMALHKDYTTYDESPFHSGLEERLGVDIDWQKPAQGANGTQAYNLMIASGDLPNMIYNGGFNTLANDLLEDGYIWDLTEYIPVYAPSYAKFLEQDPSYIKNVKTDSGALVRFSFAREDLVLGTYQGPMVRSDLLDKLGLDVPETIADWDEMLAAFKDDGVKYPLTVWGASALIPYWSSAFNVTTGYYMEDGAVTYGNTKPEFRAFLEHMKAWFDEGLLDPDFAVNDRAAVKTKALNAEVGSCITSGSTMSDYIRQAENLGVDISWVATQYPTANAGEQVKYIQRETFGTGASAVITTATAEEDIGLCCRILDYGWDPEGMIYWNFGSEDYTLPTGEPVMEFVDGVPHFTEAFLNSPEGYDSILGRYQGNNANGPGVMMVQMYADKTDPNAWAACQEWYYTAGPNHMVPPVSPTTAENNATTNYITAIDTYASENLVKFIMGDRDLAEFDQYVADIEGMGLETVLQLKQQQVERYNAR